MIRSDLTTHLRRIETVTVQSIKHFKYEGTMTTLCRFLHMIISLFTNSCFQAFLLRNSFRIKKKHLNFIFFIRKTNASNVCFFVKLIYMRKILMVEDDPITQKILTHSLSSDFEFVICTKLQEALNTMNDPHHDISLVLLDRILPDGDGIELCKMIKDSEVTHNIPVIFLTSCSKEHEKVFCFFSGADDYICKPFSVLEVKARIFARLKNVKRKIFTTNLEVDLDAYAVYIKDEQLKKEVSLTRTEFKLFAFLIQNLGRMFSREMLLQKIWGQALHVNDRVVDTHMSHLRRKLQKSTLIFESLRGEGYKITDNGKIF